MRFAERMSRLGTEGAFEVLARARALERQGRSIVHIEIGEPDFPTPEHIREAAKRALDEGHTHYTPAQGILELREAIAEHITETRKIPVHPDEVVVTPGAKPIMAFVITALAQAGDEVIFPDPGFPTYESVINFVGATPVPVPLLEERGFAFDLDVLRARMGPRTRLLVLNSPQNPTGGVLPAEDLAEIAALARRHGVPVLTDEVYNRFLYEGEFHSIASLPGMQGQCIILDGFSKAYAMTGWRLGYGVMPRDLVAQVTRLMINSNSCTAAFSQVAAIAALRGDQSPSHDMVRVFRRRRDLIVGGLNRIPGVACALPRGAFYAFPNVKALGKTSKAIADHLLTDGGVACLAGTDFGKFGEGYLRFSYVTSEDNIAEALRRVGESLARL